MGTSLIGWFDDKQTLPHDFSLPDTSSNYYSHAIPPLVFPCWILLQGLSYGFGRPQTWALNIYICVGTSLIGWLDDNHTLPHGFSVQNTPSFQYGHPPHQPCNFPSWLLNQGMP